MTLDSDNNLEYWKDLQIIVDDELYKLRKAQSKNAVESREGINPAVTHDVLQVFNGKTPTQLQVLKTQIENKIRSNEEGIDIGYWETLLSRLKAHIARARLKEMHEQNLITRSKSMEQNINLNIESNQPLFPIQDNDDVKQEMEPFPSTSTDDRNTEKYTEEEVSEQMDPTIRCVEEYNSGQYSPKLLSISEIESGILITLPEDGQQTNRTTKKSSDAIRSQSN